VGDARDEAGTPVAGVQVTLTRLDGTIRTFFSTATGAFRFDDLDVGSWTVEVKPPLRFFLDPEAPLSPTVSVTEGSETRLDVALLSEDGALPRDAPIQVAPSDGEEFFNYPRLVELHWNPVAIARYYQVEWQYCGHRDYACATPSQSGFSESADTTLSLIFVGSQVGRWRVRAGGPLGTLGPASPWRTFDYSPPPRGVSFSGYGTATIDGQIGVGEWTAARFETVLNLPNRRQTKATILVMNDSDSLYAALVVPNGGSDWRVAFTVLPDHPQDRSWIGDDYFGLEYVGGTVGLMPVDRAILSEDFCGLFRCGSDDIELGGTEDGEVAWTSTISQTVVEISHPLASGDVYDIHIDPTDPTVYLLLVPHVVLLNGGTPSGRRSVVIPIHYVPAGLGPVSSR